MPKIVDRSRQRADIRRAARSVFAERGIAGTGLEHVARAAGMGRASLYHYYADKDELITDIADELLREEAELFEQAALGEGDALQRVAAVAEAVTALYERWGDEGSIILQFWAGQTDRMRPLLAVLRDELAQVVRRGQREGDIDPDLDPPAAAAAVVGLIDGLLLQFFLDPRAFHGSTTLAEQCRSAVVKVLAP